MRLKSSSPPLFCATHIWVGRRFLPERHGHQCQICKANKGRFLVQFEDGHLVLTNRGTIKRIPV